MKHNQKYKWMWGSDLCSIMDINHVTLICCSFSIGWSAKGERWGRGQSKPSSLPAVNPVGAVPDDWRLWLKWIAWCLWWNEDPNSAFRWRRVSRIQLWMSDWKTAKTLDWSQHQNSSCYVPGPWYKLLINNCHVVFWTINEHCLKIDHVPVY